jgi:hypothetical protein
MAPSDPAAMIPIAVQNPTMASTQGDLVDLFVFVWAPV